MRGRSPRTRSTSSPGSLLRLCVGATAVVALCMLFTSHSSTNVLLPSGSLPSPSNLIHLRTLSDFNTGVDLPIVGDGDDAGDAAADDTPAVEEDTPATEETPATPEDPDTTATAEIPVLAEEPAEEPVVLPMPPPSPPPPFPPPTNFSVPAPPAPEFTPGPTNFVSVDPDTIPPPPPPFPPPPTVAPAPADESASSDDDDNSQTLTIVYGVAGAAGALALLLLAFCAIKYCRKDTAPATAEIDRQFNQLAASTGAVQGATGRTGGRSMRSYMSGRFVPGGGPPAGAAGA